MALVATDNKHYKAIADSIRTNTGIENTYTPEEMAEGVNVVYEAGKQAEYDAFWDSYQKNGDRRSYAYAFAGEGWSKDTLKPKYKITPAGVSCGDGMFYHFGLGYTDVLDFREIANLFDFSNLDTATNLFESARINFIEVDLSNVKSIARAFSGEWAKMGRTHLTLKVSEKCTDYGGTFIYATELTNLIFTDGSNIAANISISSATNLVKESIQSIIAALWDNASGKTLTLSLTAVKKAFETSSDANDGNTSEAWLALVASKPNWTITLA